MAIAFLPPPQSPKHSPRAQKTSPEIVIGVTPRLPEPTQSAELLATRVGGREFLMNVTAILSKHVEVPCDRVEHMKVSMGLRDQPGVKRAHGGDVPSRFAM